MSKCNFDSVGATSKAAPAPWINTLDSIESGAANIRSNVYDINHSLSAILSHLRGESLGESCGSSKIAPCGKIAEVVSLQSDSLNGQEETQTLLRELRELLNVNA